MNDRATAPRAGRHRERGAVVVEFALVCLLLLLLLMGTTEFGRAWYTVHMLSSAAREGARVGALMTGSAEDRAAAIRARVGRSLEPTGWTDYTVVIDGGGGYGNPLRVEVRKDFVAVTGHLIPGLAEPLHLKGTAVFNQELP
jgi:hypothetical protein